ncbi:putative nucleoside-diphosphate-sugar epimerase [Fonsecaea pedrosoi]|nr:putative nucleoside-diphosphate-sugar epimerase [Fonsecaea pedrosoi]
MKIIITGATGFVGREVVVQAIENPRISYIIVLTRRNIDETLSQSPKVQVIRHKDFLSYPTDLLQQLYGVQGCIWCLGGKVEDFPDLQTARTVGVDFTLAAANALVRGVCPTLPPEQRLRFVFCSGNGAEWHQDRKLWLFSDTRKLKGAAEQGLLDMANTHPDVFEVIVIRPGGVVRDESIFLGKIASLMTPVVIVTRLAKALVRFCIDPPPEKVVENQQILDLGS